MHNVQSGGVLYGQKHNYFYYQNMCVLPNGQKVFDCQRLAVRRGESR
jgi:hypothetical protein